MTTRHIRAAAIVLALAVSATGLNAAFAKENKGVARGHRKRTTTVVRTEPRAAIVIHQGFPIRREWPTVVVRNPAQPVRVTAPSTYLPVSRFERTIHPAALRQTTWQDSDVIRPNDDWVSTTLNVDASGRRLFLSIGGRAQVAFAEVVFENGDARVVDFGDRDVRSGRYLLLEFPDGRRVDHVRVVARARGERATLNLFLER